MMSNEFIIFSSILGLFATLFTLYGKIQDRARQSAKVFEELSSKFNQSLNQLNVTIAELNTTLAFNQREMKEIKQNHKILVKQVEDLEKLASRHKTKFEMLEKHKGA